MDIIRATRVFLVLGGLLAASPAGAHVPYLEKRDFSEQRPFWVQPPVEKSIAVYSWFHSANDLDVFAFEVDEPVRVYAQALVPVCNGYEELRPWFALVGPGLPRPVAPVPFTLMPGYGAIVVENVPPGQARETFYEPFGGKSYFDGPALELEVATPGTWYLYFWAPGRATGDYVAVIGDQEIWGLAEIFRALVVTPLIRQDRELHRACLP
jgi:hypothetical protein